MLEGHREESGTWEAWAAPGWGMWGPVTGAWDPTHPRACPSCADPAAGSFASSCCAGRCGFTDKDAFRCDLEKTWGLHPVLWAHSGQPPCRASSWDPTQLGPSLSFYWVTLIASVCGGVTQDKGARRTLPNTCSYKWERSPQLCIDAQTWRPWTQSHP